MTDSNLSVPKPPRGRRLRSRDALLVVGVAVLLLLLFEGTSIRSSAREMQPGIERDLITAVGKPAGWLADRFPLHDWADSALSWLSSDDNLSSGPGFDQPVRGPAGGGSSAAIGPESFDPAQLGKPPKRRRLRTLLATGDSMVNPLDLELARRLADMGVKVSREPHLGTGISKSDFVDWGKLANGQTSKYKADAIVVFIGANDGFDMPAPGGKRVHCCGPDWAAVYATRVRRMMDTYRRRGAARVYWLNLPLPREGRRQVLAHAVNSAIDVASVPFRSQVRVLDMEQTFTPNDRFRNAMTIGRRRRIVREPDGIHLNGDGSKLAAEIVLRALARDFAY